MNLLVLSTQLTRLRPSVIALLHTKLLKANSDIKALLLLEQALDGQIPL